jgi:spore coat polysaccharide biosynthesis protein SpsF
MKITAIIQARMGSSRLPGKIMKEVNGKPLLEYQIERVKQSKFINQIILATTNEVGDDRIEAFSNKLQIDCVRGSENDVLSRYNKAIKQFPTDIVVRLTSDCPLIDSNVIDLVIKKYLDNIDSVDYVSNTLERTYPRGMDVEVFSSNVLVEVNLLARKDHEREHVTPYIYLNDKYSILQVISQEDNSNFRWTVDTTEDFTLISEILSRTYPNNPTFKLNDIISLVNKHPELTEINNHIEQKKLIVEEQTRI